jgi:hypothetical protein
MTDTDWWFLAMTQSTNKSSAERVAQQVGFEVVNGWIRSFDRFDHKEKETPIVKLWNLCCSLTEKLEVAENKHVQFMVEGGPVVMATEFDDLKTKLALAEQERDRLDKKLRRQEPHTFGDDNFCMDCGFKHL